MMAVNSTIMQSEKTITGDMAAQMGLKSIKTEPPDEPENVPQVECPSGSMQDEVVTDDTPSEEILKPVPVKLVEVSTGKEISCQPYLCCFPREDDSNVPNDLSCCSAELAQVQHGSSELPNEPESVRLWTGRDPATERQTRRHPTCRTKEERRCEEAREQRDRRLAENREKSRRRWREKSSAEKSEGFRKMKMMIREKRKSAAIVGDGVAAPRKDDEPAGTRGRKRTKAKFREGETEEQREERLRKIRQSQLRYLAKETPEKKAKRLLKMRENQAKRLANETREQRERRLELGRLYAAKKSVKKVDCGGVSEARE